jgi:hypothetical protein
MLIPGIKYIFIRLKYYVLLQIIKLTLYIIKGLHGCDLSKNLANQGKTFLWRNL